MYVKINRNACSHQLPICERCLGRFLQEPLAYERACFEEVVDDGKEDLTIDLTSDENHVVLVLNEEQRKLMAGEGWSTFVDFPVPLSREHVGRKLHHS
jgi:hypothetical protein